MRGPLAALLLVAALLSGCTSDDPSPEDAARRLATALDRGALDIPVVVGEDVQAAYDRALGDLAEADRTVRVAGVTRDDAADDADDTAEARLAWRWDVDGHAWAYTSTATLRRRDGGWVTAWSPALVEPTLSGDEALDVTRLPAARGEILGAGGVALVQDRPVVRYGVDKTRVGARQAPRSARRVAEVLGVRPAPYVRAVRAAGPQAFVEALVLRVEDARQVDAAYAAIPGAVALDGTLPLAPTRAFAAPLLGRVGPVTAELVEKSGGRLAAGDVAGLSGLQLRYDEQLGGTPGVEVRALDAEGAARTLFTAPATDGEPLVTTLDERLQREAEAALADATDGASALVAVRPSTGAVLAAANGPGNAGLNAATYGRYPPGSTFKIVSSLALLRSGLTPASAVPCPSSTVVDGKRFENYDDYPPAALGRITLREAVAQSCNTAFVGAHDRLDPGVLEDAAASLGLGVDHDLGFPAYLGQVPAPASQTEAAADLIGQGRVLASPLAMAGVAASVQAGRTVVPHLLEGREATPTPAVPLTAPEAAALRGLMRAVVEEGSGRFLGAVGATGAKTGTAEHGEPGPAGRLPTHAWMVALRGDLAVAVFVERGESGSRTAGPLLARFLR